MAWWVPALRVAGIGFYIALSIVGGIGGGWLLDKWLGTKPWLTLGGVVLGSVVAFYGVYRMVAPLLRNGAPKN
ncbi:MAG: AtpZ/AtpI family protein [Dehalococcoidia bacterium]|nr:AtpZ/AtpI family protein [Dehalococcoidia bacterium]MDW8119426.1 AtpZ/AtpI family protein [Chloroflexota bacterium]